jgi:hypothetical protein
MNRHATETDRTELADLPSDRKVMPSAPHLARLIAQWRFRAPRRDRDPRR